MAVNPMPAGFQAVPPLHPLPTPTPHIRARLIRRLQHWLEMSRPSWSSSVSVTVHPLEAIANLDNNAFVQAFGPDAVSFLVQVRDTLGKFPRLTHHLWCFIPSVFPLF